MLLHGRQDSLTYDPIGIDPDQPHVQAVDAIDFGQDLVADGVDHAIVHAPIHCSRLSVKRFFVMRTFSAPQNIAMSDLEHIEFLVGGRPREMTDGLALDHAANLKCVAHEFEIDGSDLQASLWNGHNQARSLEPRNHLTNGAER